mmetsp:Transcript_106380/g.307854  ORF Transcript_106380/g.307854 Transcript_106380/m.307854 type:complete len:244 (+) Transcript_106380:82-813(+)
MRLQSLSLLLLAFSRECVCIRKQASREHFPNVQVQHYATPNLVPPPPPVMVAMPNVPLHPFSDGGHHSLLDDAASRVVASLAGETADRNERQASVNHGLPIGAETGPSVVRRASIKQDLPSLVLGTEPASGPSDTITKTIHVVPSKDGWQRIETVITCRDGGCTTALLSGGVGSTELIASSKAEDVQSTASALGPLVEDARDKADASRLEKADLQSKSQRSSPNEADTEPYDGFMDQSMWGFF